MTSKIAVGTDAMAARIARIGRAVAALALRASELVVALKHRRVLAQLADRDDRMLADIGLTRSDLCDASAEPPWQNPTRMLAHRAAERHIARWNRIRGSKVRCKT